MLGMKYNHSLIRSAGKQLVFVTNNSTKSRGDYKKKFDKVGIKATEVGCLRLSIP